MHRLYVCRLREKEAAATVANLQRLRHLQGRGATITTNPPHEGMVEVYVEITRADRCSPTEQDIAYLCKGYIEGYLDGRLNHPFIYG